MFLETSCKEKQRGRAFGKYKDSQIFVSTIIDRITNNWMSPTYQLWSTPLVQVKILISVTAIDAKVTQVTRSYSCSYKKAKLAQQRTCLVITLTCTACSYHTWKHCAVKIKGLLSCGFMIRSSFWHNHFQLYFDHSSHQLKGLVTVDQ